MWTVGPGGEGASANDTREQLFGCFELLISAREHDLLPCVVNFEVFV
jgi:hypothetical protein